MGKTGPRALTAGNEGMRLTCPNCDAVYEVPADAVPPEGRDVQCTNCGHSWYQVHPEAEADAEEAAAAAPSTAMTADARRILEEEAERELATRAEERGRARRPRPAPVPVPRDEFDELDDDFEDDLDDEDVRDDPAKVAPPPRARRGRDLLPDIEEFDGALKPESDRRGSRGGRRVAAEAGSDDAGSDGARSRGFRLGLGLTVLAAAAAVALYVFAPEIGARVPAIAPAMEAYGETVDGWRLALDAAARDASDRLTAWVDTLSEPEVEAIPEGG